MAKIDALRRFFLPCIFPDASATPHQKTAVPKTRLSTSLRDDLDDHEPTTAVNQETETPDQEPTSPEDNSKSILIAPTIFGRRRGHVWFCVQHDRLSTKPTLLLELSMPTNQLVKEMRCGLVRIALESARPERSTERPDVDSCPLRLVPLWIMYCNGRKVGFAVRKKASGQTRLMLRTMQSMTVGAGVIPAGFGSSGPDPVPDPCQEIMYMRANYEHMIGNADSESFHLINPDECPGQEFSVFLLRSWRVEAFLCIHLSLSCIIEMLEGKALVLEVDMPEELQSHVMELAYKALDLHEVSDCQSIAHYIKQKFDEAYEPAWHCVAGKDFGSCITHLHGSFIFFRVEMMEFLVFKDGKDLTESKEEAVGVVQTS